ncbi:dynactin subunit 3-like [Glandiceps talaboti]
MAASGSVESLEARIAELENRVFGNDKKQSQRKDGKNCIDSVGGFLQAMNTGIAGRDQIGALLKRLEELEGYLDPTLVDKLTLEDELKAEIVLAEEGHLKAQAAILEQVEQMKEILDSQHLKVPTSMSEKLQPLTVLNIKQKEKLDSVSADTRQLLTAYNDIIMLLSKQFVQWDEIVTKYEIASQNENKDD